MTPNGCQIRETQRSKGRFDGSGATHRLSAHDKKSAAQRLLAPAEKGLDLLGFKPSEKRLVESTHHRFWSGLREVDPACGSLVGVESKKGEVLFGLLKWASKTSPLSNVVGPGREREPK